MNTKKTIQFALAVIIGMMASQDVSLAFQTEIPAFLKNPTYRSDQSYRKSFNTPGNRVNITFHNYGLLAGAGVIRGEWPAGSQNNYIGDVHPVVVLEVPVISKATGNDTIFQRAVTMTGPRAGVDGPLPGKLKFYGFEAMGGFASDINDNDRPAISTDPTTWPTFWPDQPDWVDPGNGKIQWNGFFGRDIQNADFETYFWMDDDNDELLFDNFDFLPDSLDPSRKGQGLAMKVRGLQWSQFLAQDAMFWIYELTNTGTTTYERVAVGATVGTLAGGDGDSADDMAFFDQANKIVYSWDFNGLGNRNQQVGYVGYAFMESPGNPLDGIDNDGDGDPAFLNIDGFPYVQPGTEGIGNTFNISDFPERTGGGRTLAVGSPLILIDKDTFQRSIVYMPNADTTVISQGITYNLSIGTILGEKQITIQGQRDAIVVTEKNLIDDDLDGLIDEDYNLHFERRQQDVLGNIITLPSLRYKNFIDFAIAVKGRTPTVQDSLDHGFKNLMIDEDVADGIDNDGDWDALTDDVGADGKSGTGDLGEGDGVPTPGEPNFDALDVDESDQVGLSSFYYFTPPGAVRLDRNETVWRALSPGFFTTNAELQDAQQRGGIDGDFIFGSGYFRLAPGQTLRFSLALVFGENLQTITNNVQTVQEIYNRNYNFAKPPDKPTLQAFATDKRVVLYWNDIAERTVDPVLGMDFEGYKIYKSTDPFFLDPSRITDYNGNAATVSPLVQFDLNNGIRGMWKPANDTSTTGTPKYDVNLDLIDRTRGVPFYLGNDAGIVHSYVDTNVVNGQNYYYAIVAYDRGSRDFYPAENNYATTITETGQVILDINVVQVKPNAGVSGYVKGGLNGEISHPTGIATGEVFVEVLNPIQVEEGATYEISFNEAGYAASTYSVVKTVSGANSLVVNAEPIISYESVIFDGMRAILLNDPIRFNTSEFMWNAGDTTKVKARVREDVFLSNNLSWILPSVRTPFDYQVEFYDTIVDTALAGRFGTGLNRPLFAAVETYFKVKNITENRYIDFAFRQRVGGSAGSPEIPGVIDDNDQVYFFEDVDGVRQATLEFSFEYVIRRPDPNSSPESVPDGTLPVAGDVFKIVRNKSYRDADTYRFTTKSSLVNVETAREQLDKIKVVPNPYVAAASWELKLPPTITSGRGERRVDFIHIPVNSKIRIFTVRGELVKELYHNGDLNNGTVSWDLRTRENLEVAYGVYYYHVEAPDLGNKTGKLAIIK